MRHLLLIAFTLLSLSINAQCDREQDSLALIDFYNSANGMDWDTAWVLDQPMDSWYGVFLNSEGCVECIDLDGHANCELDFLFSSTQFILNVVGDLSPSLQNLNSLEKLLINRASINSGFPDWVVDMSSLQQLALRQCNISGMIPQNIGQMTNLNLLHLGANNLLGEIPPSIGELANLEELFLFSNNLSGPIPSSFGNLENLERLLMSFNFLSEEIPSELGSLSNLRQLVLSQNNLSGNIPEEFEALDNLLVLIAGNNILSGNIPSFLPSMDSLQLVELNNNDFSGCLPEEILNSCGEIIYNFNENPMLAFSGDMTLACASEPGDPIPCDDGYLGTSDDTIQDDCSCLGNIDPFECLCDFAGIYYATTTASNNMLNWCLDSIYIGTIEIQQIDEGSYLIFSRSPDGDLFEDMSFGTYYGCYGAQSEFDLPSGGYSGLLTLIADCDSLYIEGLSQFDEEYSVLDYSFANNQFSITIANSYGESWISVMTKQSGEDFPENNICYLDEDGDGFTTEFDCNDIDPTINPNAEDILDNGIDEDCDGADLSSVIDIENFRITFYPNPTSDFLLIDCENFEELDLTLVSTNGQMVQQIQSQRTNIEHLPEGLYFVQIKSRKTGLTATAKLLKQ